MEEAQEERRVGLFPGDGEPIDQEPEAPVPDEGPKVYTLIVKLELEVTELERRQLGLLLGDVTSGGLATRSALKGFAARWCPRGWRRGVDEALKLIGDLKGTLVADDPPPLLDLAPGSDEEG